MRTTTCLRLWFAGSVLLAIVIVADPLWAQELRVGKHVVIRADEVIEHDLYAFGDTVVVKGTVRGDVMASGREVTIEGTVEGDLTGCGHTYIVDGRVGDDVRIAGMTTVLGRGAWIGGDFVTAALCGRSCARRFLDPCSRRCYRHSGSARKRDGWGKSGRMMV